MEWNLWTTLFASLFGLRYAFELTLDILQTRHLMTRKDKVPSHLEGKVDIETIRKAVAYNLDKLRFGIFAGIHGVAALWIMLLYGFRLVDDFACGFGFGPLVSGLIFFGILGGASLIWGFPVEVYSIFKIEEKHGFNRQTFKGFMLDKLKEIIISSILGATLLAVILTLMERGGRWWWIIAFVSVLLIQLLITWIYPVLIMPLFNRFSPVADDLAEQIRTLATRVGFPMEGVVSMDGSKRSSHSNAFFIGILGARRVVLYDTLIEKLKRPALLGVLAHEFGHFKLKHLLRRLIFISVAMFALFAVLAFMMGREDVSSGLGFGRVSNHGALVVFSLFISEVLAPSGWFLRYLSRRDEYAADRFAVDAVQNGDDLAEALIALTKQNLGSPGSNRLYRSYHNSHPALRERLRAIKMHAESRSS